MYDILDMVDGVSKETHFCVTEDGSLNKTFFSEDFYEVVKAKKICFSCPSAVSCLEGALERGEPSGVWGGQVLHKGKILRKTVITKSAKLKYGKINRRREDFLIPVPEQFQKFVIKSKSAGRLKAERNILLEKNEIVSVTLRTVELGTFLPHPDGFSGYMKLLSRRRASYHDFDELPNNVNPENWFSVEVMLNPEGCTEHRLMRGAVKFDVRHKSWVPEDWRKI